jgi:hypothetical protein
MQPDIKGVMADSWLYSVEVGEKTPHLAWIRQFYAERGAYIVDMELADPKSGFLVGSAERRRLYEEKKFHPRQTLVLWSRADILNWAAAHPELADTRAENRSIDRATTRPPDNRYEGHALQRLTKPVSAHSFRSGQLTFVRAIHLLHEWPRLYVSLTLLIPALAAGLVGMMTLGGWAGSPAFVLAFTLMWLFQYFFLQ